MDPQTLFFVHVPKTAGRYIVSVALKHELRQGPFLPRGKLYEGTETGRMHYGGHNVVARNPDSPMEYFTHCVQEAPGWAESLRFTVIRNPFDLLVSMYTARWPYDGPTTHMLFPTFTDFIERYCDPHFLWRAPKQQQNLFFQLFDEEGRCPLHTILRQEHVDDDLAAMCAPLGITPMVGGLHKASRSADGRDHRGWYTDRTRELVEKKCAFELEWSGYDFDGLRRETQPVGCAA